MIEIDKLWKEYDTAKEKLEKALDDLDNDICKCEECYEYKYIFKGNFDEIHTRCLTCGGLIE